MKEKLRVWFRAIRPFSFTGSVVPIVLGAVLAVREGKFSFLYFLLSVIAILLLHSGVNLLSDYDDFVNKVDTEASFGSSGVIRENLLSSKEVYKGGIASLILGSLLGLFLTYERGMLIFLFGLLGVLGGYCYTGKPFALKYKGLGTPLVFMIFGPLMVLGSYYVQTRAVSYAAFFVSIPVGLLTTAILHANDIRDIQEDKKAGIKTLSIIAGKKSAHIIYYTLILSAYIALILMVADKVLPYWTLICLITIPVAVKNFITLNLGYNSIINIVALDKQTAQLHAQFGIVLILALLL